MLIFFSIRKYDIIMQWYDQRNKEKCHQNYWYMWKNMIINFTNKKFSKQNIPYDTRQKEISGKYFSKSIQTFFISQQQLQKNLWQTMTILPTIPSTIAATTRHWLQFSRSMFPCYSLTRTNLKAKIIIIMYTLIHPRYINFATTFYFPSTTNELCQQWH